MDTETLREVSSTPFEHPNPFGVNQKYWERIQNMRLMDDTLMTAAMDGNIEATQFILRILMEKDDLVVTRVKTQVEYKNLYGHSLRMDADAVDSEDDRIDIEIEREKYRASPERTRYYLSIRDASFLPQGEDYKKLPTVYIIFITEQDYWGDGCAVYHIDRKVKENGKDFKDRAHILYVNGAYVGDDRIGGLLADFRESNPNKMRNPELAKRVRALKNSEDEVRKMCKAMELTYEEGREEGRKEGHEEGREEGLKEGREEGLKEGREEGRKEGHEEGRKEGHEEGREEGLKEGREEGRKEGHEEGRKEGRKEGHGEGRIEALVQSIRSLMKRHGQTADESMDDLSIIGDERDACVAYMKAHKAS